MDRLGLAAILLGGLIAAGCARAPAPAAAPAEPRLTMDPTGARVPSDTGHVFSLSPPAVALSAGAHGARLAVLLPVGWERRRIEPTAYEPYDPVWEAPLPEGFPAPAPPGQIVLKRYPAGRAVRTAAGPEQDVERLFMTVYEFARQAQLEPTSPVDVALAAALRDPYRLELRALSMFLRAAELGRHGPVTVAETPALTVVSLAVQGSYTQERFGRALAELQEWLSEHRHVVEPAGPPRVLAYNTPLTLWWRQYAEVQVPVRVAGEERDSAGDAALAGSAASGQSTSEPAAPCSPP